MNLDSLLDPVRRLFVAKKQPSADAIAAQRKPIQDAIAQAAASRDKHLANPPDPLLASADERAKFRGRTAAFDDDIAELQQFLDALDQREQEARAREAAAALKKARADLGQRVADVDQRTRAFLESVARVGLPLLAEIAEIDIAVDRFNRDHEDERVSPPGLFRHGPRSDEKILLSETVERWTHLSGSVLDLKTGNLTVTSLDGREGRFMPDGGRSSVPVELKAYRHVKKLPAVSSPWPIDIGAMGILDPAGPGWLLPPGETSDRPYTLLSRVRAALELLENPPPPEALEVEESFVEVTPILLANEGLNHSEASS